MKLNDILLWILLILVVIQLIMLVYTYIQHRKVQEKYILSKMRDFARSTYEKAKNLITPQKEVKRNIATEIATNAPTAGMNTNELTAQVLLENEQRLLEKQRNKRTGAGILDKLKATGKDLLDVFKAPDIMPLSVKKFLDSYGNFPIVQMKVCRSPVIAAVPNTFEFLSKITSKETLRERAKKVGYDDLFHLYSLLTLQGPDGTKMLVKMEKNEIVSVEEVKFDYFTSQGGGECREVNLQGRTITLTAMFSDAIAVDPHRFWVYDQTYHNCQIFILQMLRGSNLLTPELTQFIDQDASSLLSGMGILKKLGKGVTDLAANLQHLKERTIDKIKNWFR